MNKRWNKLCVAALACVALVVPLTLVEVSAADAGC